MLISIHIPKTAGTSLSLSLIEKFGRAVRRDYDPNLFQTDTILDRKRTAIHNALTMTPEDLQGTACIHGHFLGMKYGLLAEQMPCQFATWLRHPIDRLMSHYYHWVESYDPQYATGFYGKCMGERWSFERFCLYEDYRNFQSQFLWGMSLASFEFVGITEHFDEDFERFARRYLGGYVETMRTNVTKTRPGVERLDMGLRRAIEEFHAVDMELYEAALDRRRRELAAGTRAVVYVPADVAVGS